MMRLAGIFLIATLGLGAEAQTRLSDDALAALGAHGPWPMETGPDPSNRVSGQDAAIALGKELFDDKTLSGDGIMSCASCHNSALGFGDGLARALGRDLLDRNTPGLFNLRLNRWFGWDGANDNLWAQSIRPLTDPLEMNATPEHVAGMIAANYEAEFAKIFGPMQNQSTEEILVNVGKAMAAYQETLTSAKTAFDEFFDAVAAEDWDRAGKYPDDAVRGFEVFVGKGNCSLCHIGPNFTNGEFHDAGVPYFLGPGRVDEGRYRGLNALLESPFTLDGEYSDDPERLGAWAVRSVRRQHSDFGVFRVPSLRNLNDSAPYMHDGSMDRLEDVINHYSEINTDRLHSDGEAILRPLNLTEQEKADLKAFLLSLSLDR